eukprot:Protomagalhaensia_wolfi_Nauph_80__4148@NODE_4217_length_613_cov_91_229965_g3352_i0_p1_GENE_NODE_4217_length_613_cov_91_229965_g3352_i0NODE_4217_length_613_cov_91_229965_g3352_i0_p1_ORF_typecomplete_len118_score10_99ArsB/PF02040_15/0_38_NODE_4217_length_613_cov_91_229965_g3352_i0201554
MDWRRVILLANRVLPRWCWWTLLVLSVGFQVQRFPLILVGASCIVGSGTVVVWYWRRLYPRLLELLLRILLFVVFAAMYLSYKVVMWELQLSTRKESPIANGRVCGDRNNNKHRLYN